jgi:hypothetical protein
MRRRARLSHEGGWSSAAVPERSGAASSVRFGVRAELWLLGVQSSLVPLAGRRDHVPVHRVVVMVKTREAATELRAKKRIAVTGAPRSQHRLFRRCHDRAT